MCSSLMLATLAAFGVTYQWQPIEDGQGGHEYVVTVEPELIQAALDGDAKTFASDVPANVKQVRRVRIVLGDGQQESVQDLVQEAGSAVKRHNVARPDFDKPTLGADEPVRHTVRQYSYSNQPTGSQSAMEQGFQQYNTPTAEQRKSIGGELYKGAEKVVDETGRVLRDAGEATRGTFENMRDGVRSVLTGPTPTAAAAQPNGAYQPYSYNQPSPTSAPLYTAPTGAAGNQYPTYSQPTGNQPTGAAQPGSTWQSNQSQPSYQQPTGQQQPTTTAPGGQYAGPSATPTGVSQPTDYRNSNPPAYGDNRFSNTQYSNQGNTNPQNGSPNSNPSFVNLIDPSGDSAPDLVDLSPTGQSGGNNQPGYQPPAGQWPQAPSVPNPGSTAGQNSQSDPWGAWPASNQGGATQQPSNQPPTGYGSNYPPAGGQYTGNQNPNNWPGAIDTPGPSGQNPQAGQPVQMGEGLPANNASYPWMTLVTVAAIGSIAWNFFLGMNYIDARNKYRAALRRTGRAYSDAYDDA